MRERDTNFETLTPVEVDICMHVSVRMKWLAGIVLLCAACHHQSRAQSPTIGVTWSLPDDTRTAVQQLRTIRSAGIRAVRTSMVQDSAVFAEADSLGITLFQDMGVGYLPAQALKDSLDYARHALRSMLAMADRFRSGRHIGLARLVDTSDPAACAYFRALAEELVRSAVPVTTYYTTPYLRSDVCNDTVDGILLETRDMSTARLQELTDDGVFAGRTVLGLASLGTWVDLDRDNRGVSNRQSPEWQARYLEDALGILTGSETEPVGYVFVHRWQDPIGLDDEHGDIVQRRYGLNNSSGGPRPALSVVSGFATGQQTVFAFEDHNDPSTRWMWMTLAGWLTLLGLALVYGTSPQMRHMVPRYFLSHGFYREAVATGRESLPAETIAFLASVSIGVGMLLATFLYELSLLPVFEVGRVWIDPDIRNFAGALLDQPWTLSAVLASAYALTIVGWTSTMSFISRAGTTLVPAQTLMLVVWSHWPLLILLLAAPAIAASDPGIRLRLAVLAVASSAVVGLVSVARTLLDFFSISRAGPAWMALGILLHPIIAATIAAGVIVLGRYSNELEFVLHLLGRP